MIVVSLCFLVSHSWVSHWCHIILASPNIALPGVACCSMLFYAAPLPGHLVRS